MRPIVIPPFATRRQRRRLTPGAGARHAERDGYVGAWACGDIADGRSGDREQAVVQGQELLGR